MLQQVRSRRFLSRLVASLVAIFACALPASPHEVQPAVADLEIQEVAVTITIELTLEAPLAGIDLAGLLDTNDASNAEAYDARRALPPDALAAELRAAWDGISRKITLMAGDEALTLELEGAQIPEVGDPEVPRLSTIRLSATLPPGDSPVIFGWDASLGGLILRQQGVEDGYTAYLQNGDLSDPIPRSGGSAQSAVAAFLDYVGVGFDHIIPKGLDHILFVLGLFFCVLKLGPLLWQVTAFTLAHTVTLALGALEIVRIPPEIVEPLIAASIAYVGIENVLSRGMQPWRPVVVFCFGLLHGLGFASVLADFGLGESHFVPKLIGFNVGVELGQLAVIAVAFVTVGSWAGQKEWYKARIANPASILIAMIGTYWVFERVGLIG